MHSYPNLKRDNKFGKVGFELLKLTMEYLHLPLAR